MKFTSLNLNDKILEAISYMGFEEATKIQEEAIPKILAGKDLLACAQTGTGKTAAFILPVLNQLAENPGAKISALVIAPTRELALQIDQQIQAFAYFLGINSIAVYGGGDGDDWETQKRALMRGADIVVATPGKLMSHMNLGYVDFRELRYLILDEADRMLDMGFSEDIEKIIKKLPAKRQTLLFSATMPTKIKKLARDILKDHDEISLALSKPAEGILQGAYLVYPEQRIPLVSRLIKDKPNYKSIIIFSSTKREVLDITSALKQNGFSVAAISSDLAQKEREEVLRDFRARKTRIIVATDVLSRGIDIKDIDLVINFHVPGDAEDYVHRIGRTARAASTGVALTMITPAEKGKFKQIEALIGKEVVKMKLPPEIGEGPGAGGNQHHSGSRDGRGAPSRSKSGAKRYGSGRSNNSRKEKDGGRNAGRGKKDNSNNRNQGNDRNKGD